MNETHGSVDLVEAEYVVGLAGAALIAALTGALAHLAVPYPFSQAPFTMQVLGVLLAGIFLGARWGTISMLLYLAAGAVGAPVFSLGSAGTGVLLSYTGGYLFSYPVATAVIGLVAYGKLGMADPTSVSIPRLAAGLAAGTIVIYVLGVIGMMLVLELSPIEAIITGAVVFVPGELGKIIAAIGIAQSGHVTDWPPRSVRG